VTKEKGLMQTGTVMTTTGAHLLVVRNLRPLWTNSPGDCCAEFALAKCAAASQVRSQAIAVVKDQIDHAIDFLRLSRESVATASSKRSAAWWLKTCLHSITAWLNWHVVAASLPAPCIVLRYTASPRPAHVRHWRYSSTFVSWESRH
jgi:hypothetical protein